MKKNISVNKLIENKGQIEGLPKNPRFIRDDKFEKLKKSLQDDPEMLELRELIVYPHDDKFIVICGNMRHRAAKELGLQELPCKVLNTDIPAEKLRAITAKDNVSYGAWDMDILVEDWITEELLDFGIDIPIIDVPFDVNSFFEDAGPTEEKKKCITCPHCGETIDL